MSKVKSRTVLKGQDARFVNAAGHNADYNKAGPFQRVDVAPPASPAPLTTMQLWRSRIGKCIDDARLIHSRQQDFLDRFHGRISEPVTSADNVCYEPGAAGLEYMMTCLEHILQEIGSQTTQQAEIA